MNSLEIALNLVRGPEQLPPLEPLLAPLLFSDLLEIKKALPEVETALLEI